MKKKIFGLALALALALQMMPAVSAAEDPLELARKAILDGIAQGQTSISLGLYNLRKTQVESLYDELYYSNQLPWYVESYQYTYEEETGKVVTFSPKLLDESKYDRHLYERKVAEILAETVHPGMSPVQIALSVHDYLAANFQYDETKTYYEGYDLLIRGTAVCSGYAEAYMELLKRAGVECHYVISEIMDHGWNQVKIGENWYHVDVTWDDPTPNVQGNANHTFFLLSDEAIGSMEKTHFGYEALHKSDDTTYDGEDFWDTSSSRICYESKDVSYIHQYQGEDHIICRVDGTESKELYRYSNQIKVNSILYSYETVGLHLAGDRLYFCSGETVFSLATDGTDLREEHTETISDDHGVLGCHQEGDTLHLTTWDLKETYGHKTLKLENVATHNHEYEQQRYEGACEQKGGKAYTCQCGVTYRIEDQSAPGHDYQIAEKKPRGLLENGWENWECSRCGDAFTTTQYGILSKEFLTDEDTLPWLLGGAVVLILIIRKAGKKK